ncbi:unnamed protein product [Camellia sinensis]
MAKKKTTHHNRQDDKPPQNPHHTHQAAMDDASEKLDNLKSLNSILLKEAVERRQQVESLLHSKGFLESELNRSDMEKQGLQSELVLLHDLAAQLELERDLVYGFVGVQVSEQAEVVEKERDGFWREKVEIEGRLLGLEREMKEVVREKSEIEKVRRERESEIGVLKKKLRDLVVEIENERDGSSRLCRERDVLNGRLDAQIEETNGLRLELNEAEKRERKIQEEVEKMKMKYNAVMEEKNERERRIESVLRDKDSIERNLAESNRVIEELKTEIEEIVSEKKGIEEERSLEMMKKKEFETAVGALNEKVVSLQKEEQRLRANVADLEKRYVESVEMEKQMVEKIDVLVKEMKEKERSFESLIEEKGLIKKDLNQSLKGLDDQKRKMDEIVRKKIEIEEAKVRAENEIVEMQREMGELMDDISALEASCRNQTEKNEQLQSVVNRYRDEITQITIERNEDRKGFEDEKKISISLRERVLEMEKKIKETQKVVGQMKAENCNVIEEKNELESRCDMLMKEIATLENSLLKGRKEFDDMKAKVEAANAKSEHVLKMLRNTGGIVCLSKDGIGLTEYNGIIDEEQVGEEVKPYVAELEAIQNAFKNRDAKVEGMKQQLVILQNSVAEARKGKNFWTLVSSATTIFAAASVAYVARIR